MDAIVDGVGNMMLYVTRDETQVSYQINPVEAMHIDVVLRDDLYYNLVPSKCTALATVWQSG